MTPTKQYRDHAEEIADAIAHRNDPPPLTPDTIVYWPTSADGSRGRFGDLPVQDRKVVEWDAVRGEYVGCYPF